MLNYSRQYPLDVVGSSNDGAITRVALTDYYNSDGTTTHSFGVAGMTKVELFVSYLAGVGEIGNSVQIKVEGSIDGTNFGQFVNDSSSGGVSTLNTRQFSISQSTTEGYLLYDAQSANFTAGLQVTGGTSSATGYIESDTDSGATGSLLLSNITGTFQNNEAITDSGTGAATVDGVLQSLTNVTVPVDISTKTLRISVKETGVATNAGSVYISALVSGL